MLRRSALLGATLLLAAACSQVSSDKVTTEDLDATILLTGDGDGILDNAYDKGSITGSQHTELTLRFHQRPEDFATSSASPTA